MNESITVLHDFKLAHGLLLAFDGSGGTAVKIELSQ